MAIARQTMTYTLGEKTFESLAVWDDAAAGPRPGVLVAPTFMGRTAFEDARAERLAGMGCVGVSIDIFGTEVRPTSDGEAAAAMQVLNDDRVELAARMTEALAQMTALDTVDAARTAAIGFCFGGKCVLDLARTGADLRGVATFHGIFDAPAHETAPKIAAKVLALHGWDDPLATPEDVIAFGREMDAKGADWELVAYGATVHAFTNPKRPGMYSAQADARSWARFADFLVEVMG